MAKTTIILTTVFMVVVISHTMKADSWALASYAQKYGMGCKICHSFGSSLNELGQTFKKNGHNFGEKNAVQKEKPKQDATQVDKSKVSESQGKAASKSESKTDAESAAEKPDEEEQPLPETKVYSWKADDGTMHFSDSPYVKTPGEKKASTDKAEKKIVRAGFRPLSAAIPKKLKKPVMQTKAEISDITHSPKTGSRETAEVAKEIIPGGQPKSFEDCMERILAANPSPKTSESVMELFQEAETICVPFENKRKR